MITICGEVAVPDASGVLWLPGHATLVVSDLHLEKGSSYARRGVVLPPYDTRTTLRRLAQVLRRFAPARVVSLGDSFHDPEGPSRLSAADRDTLRAMTARHDWIWIAGNHEGLLDGGGLGGCAAQTLELGRLVLRHEPGPAPATGEVAGHLHPVAAISARGRRLRRRCFVTDTTRLVMPAFGAYTGGLNVLDAAFVPLFDAGLRVWAMGERAVYPIATARLVPDRARPAGGASGCNGPVSAQPQARTAMPKRVRSSASTTRIVSRTR